MLSSSVAKEIEAVGLEGIRGRDRGGRRELRIARVFAEGFESWFAGELIRQLGEVVLFAEADFEARTIELLRRGRGPRRASGVVMRRRGA